jgi:hypothetical protein
MIQRCGVVGSDLRNILAKQPVYCERLQKCHVGPPTLNRPAFEPPIGDRETHSSDPSFATLTISAVTTEIDRAVA